MVKNLIYELELSLLKPETRRSPAQLNQLIADDFVEFGSSGNIYHKKDCIDHLPLESTSDKDFKVENFEVIELAADVILATYKITSPCVSLRSSIWKRIDGQWQMIFHQGTRCEKL